MMAVAMKKPDILLVYVDRKNSCELPSVGSSCMPINRLASITFSIHVNLFISAGSVVVTEA